MLKDNSESEFKGYFKSNVKGVFIMGIEHKSLNRNLTELYTSKFEGHVIIATLNDILKSTFKLHL